jgi:hypothetical protein
MAKKKQFYYNMSDIFRQDKLDTMAFSFVSGIRSVAPKAKLQECALAFQAHFGLTEEECSMEILLASLHRSFDKYQRYIMIDDDFLKLSK